MVRVEWYVISMCKEAPIERCLKHLEAKSTHIEKGESEYRQACSPTIGDGYREVWQWLLIIKLLTLRTHKLLDHYFDHLLDMSHSFIGRIRSAWAAEGGKEAYKRVLSKNKPRRSGHKKLPNMVLTARPQRLLWQPQCQHGQHGYFLTLPHV